MCRRLVFSATFVSLALSISLFQNAAFSGAAIAGNVPVCTSAGDQGAARSVSDGAGGMIVAWQDSRTGSDIYAQRTNAAGTALWAINGVAVCAVPGIHSYPVLVSDGAGGAIIAWIDARGGAIEYDIYAQRVNAAGVPLWAAGGVPLCAATGDQSDPRIVPDGAGGAIVTWDDHRSAASYDIYAQRVNGAGARLWTANGVPVCDAPSTPPFLLAWGGYGVFAGQLDLPTGVAVDASGNVYVADQNNHRIQKFDMLGNFVLLWGSLGAGKGQFNAPTGVATDPAGDVYVADLSNSRIQKFDPTGGYITEWGSNGSGNGQFISPTGVATDPGGDVYVADSGNHRIQKFTGTGSYLTRWGSFGSGNGQFAAPRGLATDAGGNVYVADQANHRIQKFTSAGTYLAQWGGAGSGPGQLSVPTGVAVDALGNVFVADRGNHRIQEFTGAGVYVTRWGSLGIASGQFNNPFGLSVDAAGNLFVADTGNDRMQKFAALPTGDHFNPTIATDAAGGAIITWRDYRGGASHDFDIFAQRMLPDGTPAWTVDGVALCTLAADQFGPTIVADGAGGAIVSWEDWRAGPNSDIYAQRVNASGVPQWPAGGVALCAASGDQYAPSDDEQGMVSDGAGGAIAAWQDGRNGLDSDIYAQRINAAGAPQWTAGGVALCTALDFQIHPRIASDGAGGVIASWYDWRSGTNSDIYAQRVNAAGTPLWTADGLALCTEPGDQQSPKVIADGAGGAVVVWSDYRTGSDWDIYAQHVNSLGTLGVSDGETAAAPRVLGMAAPWPNPSRGAITLEYTLSRAGQVRLSVYDVAGRRVSVLQEGETTAGPHRASLMLRGPAGGELAPGLYVVRLEAEGRVLTRRLAAIR